MNDIFETATRNKIRYASVRGELTTEHLWDVPLRSADGFNLDAVARTASLVLKNATQESFVTPERTPAHERFETALEVVKRVIAVKLVKADPGQILAQILTDVHTEVRLAPESRRPESASGDVSKVNLDPVSLGASVAVSEIGLFLAAGLRNQEPTFSVNLRAGEIEAPSKTSKPGS